MKRVLVTLVSVALLAGLVATAEAKSKPTRVERTVELSYDTSDPTGCSSWFGMPCFIIPTRATEQFFTAKVTDATGLPLYLQVHDGERVARFCGATPKPMRLAPHDGARPGSLTIYVGLPGWAVQTTCPAYSVKTIGKVSVTLSNLP